MASSTARRSRRIRDVQAAETCTPLVQVTRSEAVESVHTGAIAVVAPDGELVAHAGPVDLPVYWRSAAKLHQALALVLEGGLKRWDFDDAQLAIMCGSHHGEPSQVQCVASILERIGLDAASLHCGTLMPRSEWAAAELIRRGDKPTPLHHMCSGNHAGLMALSRLLGADPGEYEEATAPAEQNALEVAARFAGLEPQDVGLGVDGCGIPAYRTPLNALALAFARLLAVPADWEPRLHSAAAAIVNAVTRHPDQISGPGRIDAECIRVFEGNAICKLGAEGVCAAAFRPTGRFSNGLGLAFKLCDGTGARAIPVVLAECIAQLELGTEAQREALDQHVERAVKTHRGTVVGGMTANFELTVETLPS